jgi:hypothetical protein
MTIHPDVVWFIGPGGAKVIVSRQQGPTLASYIPFLSQQFDIPTKSNPSFFRHSYTSQALREELCSTTPLSHVIGRRICVEYRIPHSPIRVSTLVNGDRTVRNVATLKRLSFLCTSWDVSFLSTKSGWIGSS